MHHRASSTAAGVSLKYGEKAWTVSVCTGTLFQGEIAFSKLDQGNDVCFWYCFKSVTAKMKKKMVQLQTVHISAGAPKKTYLQGAAENQYSVHWSR
mmetsp:Transcript_14790/g.21785  ORF Transcript_14790/g.21785 Transcript_14790/m.21785 type:complete len:96 (+) Transcript_14790:2057-2344(+)